MMQLEKNISLSIQNNTILPRSVLALNLPYLHISSDIGLLLDIFSNLLKPFLLVSMSAKVSQKYLN